MESNSSQVIAADQYFKAEDGKQTLQTIKRDDQDQFELELKEKIAISHDTYKFIFKLPAEDQVLGLPVGGHLIFHIEIDGDVVSRKYTPVSQINEKGVVVFVIKIYRKTDEFPKGGKMSQALEHLNAGDKVKMEGPKGLLSYIGNGNFLIKNKPVKKTKIGMIAGGTGLTPIYQVA